MEGLPITSGQNPKVKALLMLQQKSQERRRTGLYVVEGLREMARLNACDIQSLFYCPAILGNEGMEMLDGMVPEGTECYEVSANVYDKMAYRSGTEGVICIVRQHPLLLESLSQRPLDGAPLYVVLESVEKPGNLGAILRSADAAGVDAVIVCDPLTDLYNPNLIRSSTGAVFSVPCVACTSQECISFLKKQGVKILTAQLQDSHLYYDTDMTCATAIVMGTEATGLTDQWREAADAHIRIPMLGICDSLNVSVSAAVLMYEAVRQRKAGEMSE